MIQCAVVGASGYSGAELVALLAVHPAARIVSVHAESSAGETWGNLHPGRRHLFDGRIDAFDPARLEGLDVVFLALPHGRSALAARALRGRVGCVIDLSGDLRLPDAATYRQWYGQDHPAPELLGQAAYGLPELFGCALRGADLVACAGCYATCVQLAAAAALGGLPVAADVVASAVSGTSGAGRKSELALSFTEVFGDVRAYRVGRHQHAPEMALGLTRACGRPVSVTFVPHLVPIARGIHATVVLRRDAPISQDEALAAYRERHADAPFVRVIDPRKSLPAISHVVGTNFCDVAPVVDEAGGTLVVTAVLDNLVKGAAGQAVQVMNLVLGLPEAKGLLPAGHARA